MWLEQFFELKSKLLFINQPTPYNIIHACKQVSESQVVKSTLDFFLTHFLDAFSDNYVLNKEYAKFISQAMIILILKVKKNKRQNMEYSYNVSFIFLKAGPKPTSRSKLFNVL